MIRPEEGKADPENVDPEASVFENEPVDEAVGSAQAIEPEISEKISKTQVDEARKKYFKARQELEGFGLIPKFLGGLLATGKAKENYKKAQKALATAEKEYKQLRGEFIAGSVDNFIAEQEEFLKERVRKRDEVPEGKGGFGKAKTLAKRAGKSLSKGSTKLYEGYKGLGEKWNLEKALEKNEKGKKLLGVLDKATLKIKGGELNIGRAAVRFVNARTAVSFSLLGVGVVAGFTSAVGLAAIGGKRVMAGYGTAFGLYDLGNKRLIEKRDRNSVEEGLSELRAGKVRNNARAIKIDLATLEAHGLLAGKTLEEIQADKVYQGLLGFYKKGVESELTYLSEYSEEGSQELNQFFDYLDSRVDREINLIKIDRRFLKAITGLFGTVVGSGILAHLFGNKTALAQEVRKSASVQEASQAGLGKAGKAAEALNEQPPAAAPSVVSSESPAVKPPEPPPVAEAPKVIPPAPETPVAAPKIPSQTVEATAAPKSAAAVLESQAGEKTSAATGLAAETEKIKLRGGAWAEVKGKDLHLHAGSRGIEGAFLDLKAKDPEKFKQMVEWLKEKGGVLSESQDPHANDPDRLIHRYVLKMGEENDFTVGGGGQDLNRIFEAEMTVKPDGQIVFDTENFKFMPPQETITASAPQTQVELGSKVAGTLSAEDAAEAAKVDLAEAELQNRVVENSNLGEVLSEKIKQPEPAPALKAVETAPAKVTASEAQVSQADLAKAPVESDAGNLTQKAEQTANIAPSAPEISVDKLYEEARGMPEASKALSHLLPPEQYDIFLQRLDLNQAGLNSLGNMNMFDFIEKLDADSSFQKDFRGLGKFIHNLMENDPEVGTILSNDENLKRLSVKTFLLNVVKVARKRGVNILELFN